jgi:hypothetical protein
LPEQFGHVNVYRRSVSLKPLSCDEFGRF